MRHLQKRRASVTGTGAVFKRFMKVDCLDRASGPVRDVRFRVPTQDLGSFGNDDTRAVVKST